MTLSAEDLARELDDVLGENSTQLGISDYLDTGLPELNNILSGSYKGGAPAGRMIEVFGPASSGKTFLSTMLMIAAQKKGGIAGFSDHERTFDPVLAQMLGMSVASHQFRYLRPQTFEESVDKAIHFCEAVRRKGLIPDEAPLVWVFDSVASMIPHSKLFDEKGNRREVGDHNMRDSLALAKATSQSYPLLAQFAEDNNMLVVLLNQIRMKPGVMYGDPLTTPGGKAAEFYASIRLSLGKKDIVTGKGDEKEVVGALVSAKTTKNKCGPAPFQIASWQIRFEGSRGARVDHIGSNVDFMVRKGIIPKEGNRVVWEGKKLYPTQLIDQLSKDPEANDKLMALLPDQGELDDIQEGIAGGE